MDLVDKSNPNPKSLYRWNRFESKSKPKISSDEIESIHQWLRKVEDASETAINVAFKGQKPAAAKSKASSASAYDDPYSEAHDLINKWVVDKIRLDLDDDITDYVKPTEMHKIDEEERDLREFKKKLLSDDDDFDSKLDHFLNDIKHGKADQARLSGAQARENKTKSMLDISGFDYDKYSEAYIAKDIVSQMLKKDVVDKDELLADKDARDQKAKNRTKVVDYQAKMDMRQQIVKENRERRQRELDEKRRERVLKKEIEFKAKQMVQREENEKRMKQNLEEELLEKEVQRLRAVMNEQRKQEAEIRKKQLEIEFLEAEREKEEMANIQKKLEIAQTETSHDALLSKRNEMAEKRAEDLLNTFLRSKQMRLMQKVFSSWFGYVLDERLKIGKANALADWRISYKVFNAWKKMCISEKIKRDQALYQDHVKAEYLKAVKASKHYDASVTRRFFNEWRRTARAEVIKKNIELESSKTKNRMQKFLEAAANNQLAIRPPSEQGTERSHYDEDRSTANSKPSSRSSARPSFRSRPSTASSRGDLSSAHQKPPVKQRSNPLNRSRSFEGLNDLTKPDEDKEPSQTSSRPRSGKTDNASVPSTNDDSHLEKKVKEMMWPWVKTPFIINNYDNRFKAQEKLLHDQQKMMKEQQKLIEDLKYQQSQMALKEQLNLLEEIKAQQLELEKMQQIQYKQEKKLLRQKAAMIKLERSKSAKEGAPPSKNDESLQLWNENDNENDETLIGDGEGFSSEEDVNLFVAQGETDSKKTASGRAANRSSSRPSTGNKQPGPSPSDRSATSLSSRGPGLNPKLEGFYKNMEERARMRDQMKREREEKRKAQELEKLESIKAQQAEKLKQEEEERRKRNEELKERRRVQKELEEKRNAEKNREQQQVTKAEAFYERYLLRHYCMNGLKLLMKQREHKVEAAGKHYRLVICRKVLVSWNLSIRIDLDRKKLTADLHYQRLLLRVHYFYGLKRFKECLQIETAKAKRFYSYQLKVKLFSSWRVYTANEKVKAQRDEETVEEFNQLRIKRTYFKMMRAHPGEMKRLRLRQKRLDDLRSKVRELIPDYEAPP